MIDTAENAIISLLKDNFTDYDVQSYPAKFEEYRFYNPQGCLLTQFQAANFAKSRDIDVLAQNVTLTFALYAGLRYPRTHKEAYPVLSDLLKTLTGHYVDGFGRLNIQSLSYLDEIDGDLWYGLTCTLSTLNVQKADIMRELDKLYPEQSEITHTKEIITKGAKL